MLAPDTAQEPLVRGDLLDPALLGQPQVAGARHVQSQRALLLGPALEVDLEVTQRAQGHPGTREQLLVPVQGHAGEVVRPRPALEARVPRRTVDPGLALRGEGEHRVRDLEPGQVEEVVQLAEGLAVGAAWRRRREEDAAAARRQPLGQAPSTLGVDARWKRRLGPVEVALRRGRPMLDPRPRRVVLGCSDEEHQGRRREHRTILRPSSVPRMLLRWPLPSAAAHWPRATRR